MVTIRDDEVTLPSGNSLYANCGIVGLAPDGDVYTGYDNAIYSGDIPLASDRVALADHMIEQWTKYRDRANLASQAERA